VPAYHRERAPRVDGRDPIRTIHDRDRAIRALARRHSHADRHRAAGLYLAGVTALAVQPAPSITRAIGAVLELAEGDPTTPLSAA
jgi:hypothetical protein